MTIVRRILELLHQNRDSRVLLLSSEKGFGSGIVKVVSLDPEDITVFEEFTQEVTYFSEHDNTIKILQKQRRHTFGQRNERHEEADE